MSEAEEDPSEQAAPPEQRSSEEEPPKSSEEAMIDRLDHASFKLKEQGQYIEALECMERSLVLRQHVHSSNSEEVWEACKELAQMTNLLAMQYLQQGDFDQTLELLQKAEVLSVRDDASKAVTYNNFACYYRRLDRPQASVTFLEKALAIEARLPEVENPADTHLNMCAVLSQMGRHKQALEHAQSALILLQAEIFGKKELPDLGRVVVLAIAYHNIGVEYEFLKSFEKSLESYRKGVLVAEKHLGEGHAMTASMRQSFLAASQSCAAQRKGRIERQNKSALGGWSQRVANQQSIRSVDGMSQRGEMRMGAISNAYNNDDASGAAGRRKVKKGKKKKKNPGKVATEGMVSPRPGQAGAGDEQSESKEVEEEGVSVYRKGLRIPMLDEAGADSAAQKKYMMVQVTEFKGPAGGASASVTVVAYDVKAEAELRLVLTADDDPVVGDISGAPIEGKWELASALVDKVQIKMDDAGNEYLATGIVSPW